jgi:hypothetical protein
MSWVGCHIDAARNGPSVPAFVSTLVSHSTGPSHNATAQLVSKLLFLFCLSSSSSFSPSLSPVNTSHTPYTPHTPGHAPAASSRQSPSGAHTRYARRVRFSACSGAHHAPVQILTTITISMLMPTPMLMIVLVGGTTTVARALALYLVGGDEKLASVSARWGGGLGARVLIQAWPGDGVLTTRSSSG